MKHLYSDWILVSNQIDGNDKYSILTDLKPATWYSLLVTAHSEAGPTDREYSFATLTDNGGKFNQFLYPFIIIFHHQSYIKNPSSKRGRKQKVPTSNGTTYNFHPYLNPPSI